ncbi:MAG: hypothetical protein KatS3mg096_531 [Candidatus Parcubacteria bacterium]|nr:MAG: hypothetical protein KatS3mg096_531 [Candidatus Parcubacteria bacterium]
MGKKSVYIGLITILIIVIGGLALFKLTNKQSQTNNNQAVSQFSVPNIPVSEDLLEKFMISEPTSTESINFQQLQQTSTQPQENLYTLEEVSQNNSKESCWTVIRDRVYDLTEWIDKHPGGEDKVLSICGKDGTQVFERKHGGQEKPEEALKRFEIGKLRQ